MGLGEPQISVLIRCPSTRFHSLTRLCREHKLRLRAKNRGARRGPDQSSSLMRERIEPRCVHTLASWCVCVHAYLQVRDHVVRSWATSVRPIGTSFAAFPPDYLGTSPFRHELLLVLVTLVYRDPSSRSLLTSPSAIHSDNGVAR